jgi:hypothetical protein
VEGRISRIPCTTTFSEDARTAVASLSKRSSAPSSTSRPATLASTSTTTV